MFSSCFGVLVSLNCEVTAMTVEDEVASLVSCLYKHSRYRYPASLAIIMLPTGLSSNQLETTTAKTTPKMSTYLLFFGFIREYKGLDLLLQAMSDSRLRQMNIRLIVAGEYYGNREVYEQQLAGLDIENRLVMRTDYIPNEEVRFYFGAADLIVQPYKSATQSGISQIAYHFEKPMLVTDVGGLGEIVPNGEAGYVVPVSAAAIADAIVDFFQNDRSAVFTKGVTEGKRRFSWRSMAEGLEELWKKVG